MDFFVTRQAPAFWARPVPFCGRSASWKPHRIVLWLRPAWHSPCLKAGDSCFNGHYAATKAFVLHGLHRLKFPMPYGIDMHSGGGKPFPENVYRRVFIPVVCCMADRTLPCANRKVLYQWIPVTTARTCLTAWIQSRYFDYVISVPCSLVFKHCKEPGPWTACYVLCKFMITNHSFYIQVFNTDSLVFANKYRWLLL